MAGAFYGVVNPVLMTAASGSGRSTDVGWWQSSARLGQVLGPIAVRGLLVIMPGAWVLAAGAGGAAVVALVSAMRRA